jgi:catechol 2,3-dioxygenase-like lactoylglutathione lyase family enzyme
MANASLKLLVLKTNQLDALCEFYGLLGIEFTLERHGNGPEHYAGKAGDCVFEIYPLRADSFAADKTTRLGFAVENLAALFQAFETAGIKIDCKPEQTAWGVRAVVRDPDGRAVELYQRQS